jgi:hypothetical protein
VAQTVGLCLSPWRHKFQLGSVDARFVVDKVAFGQAFVALSMLFHQYFTIIFIYVLAASVV